VGCGEFNGNMETDVRDCYAFDGNAWAPMPAMIQKFCPFARATKSHYVEGIGLYVTGPKECDDEVFEVGATEFVNELYTLDGKWIPLNIDSPGSKWPVFPFGSCSTPLNSTHVFISGGLSVESATHSGHTNATWILNLETLELKPSTDMMMDAAFHGCGLTQEGEVLTTGGIMNCLGCNNNFAFLFNPVTGKWRLVEDYLPNIPSTFTTTFLSWNGKPLMMNFDSSTLFSWEANERWLYLHTRLGGPYTDSGATVVPPTFAGGCPQNGGHESSKVHPVINSKKESSLLAISQPKWKKSQLKELHNQTSKGTPNSQSIWKKNIFQEELNQQVSQKKPQLEEEKSNNQLNSEKADNENILWIDDKGVVRLVNMQNPEHTSDACILPPYPRNVSVILNYLPDRDVVVGCGEFNGNMETDVRDCYAFDGNAWAPMPAMIQKFCPFARATKSHYVEGIGLYVTGPKECDDEVFEVGATEFVNELYTLDGKWIPLNIDSPGSKWPVFPFGSCSTPLNSTHVFISGGLSVESATHSGHTNATWILNLETLELKPSTDMMMDAAFHGCGLTQEGEVLTTGGIMNCLGCNNNFAFLFNPVTGKWRLVEDYLPNIPSTFTTTFLSWNGKPLMMNFDSSTLFSWEANERWLYLHTRLGGPYTDSGATVVPPTFAGGCPQDGGHESGSVHPVINLKKESSLLAISQPMWKKSQLEEELHKETSNIQPIGKQNSFQEELNKQVSEENPQLEEEKSNHQLLLKKADNENENESNPSASSWELKLPKPSDLKS